MFLDVRLIAGLQQQLHKRPALAALLALMAGASYPFSMAPFDQWYLPFGAIFILLCCLDAKQPKQSLLRLYGFSVGISAVGISWVYVSIHEHGHAPPLLAGALVALLVLAVSVFILLPGWLYIKIIRPGALGVTLGFSAMWLLKEWMSTWLFSGFPWLLAGYSQLNTPLAAYAPVFGVLGVGFAVCLTSALLFVIITAPARRHQLASLLALALIWLGGLALSKSEWVLPVGEPIKVSLVQGNIDQATKWQEKMIRPIVDTYIDLSQDEWGRHIILWPEASITLLRHQAASLLNALDWRGKQSGSSLLLGIPARDESGGFLNTATVVGAGSGTYIKRHLVPFGEYVPLESMLRGLIQLFDLPMSRNQPGAGAQPLPRAEDLRLAISICYEVIFPDLVRDSLEAPDLLITISNDAWFGASIGPLQHAQMARMRALENGRFMLRATNNGVTAIIDPSGRVISALPQFQPGVLRGLVFRMSGITPFAHWGHKPLLFLLGIALSGLVIWQRLKYNAQVL